MQMSSIMNAAALGSVAAAISPTIVTRADQRAAQPKRTKRLRHDGRTHCTGQDFQ